LFNNFCISSSEFSVHYAISNSSTAKRIKNPYDNSIQTVDFKHKKLYKYQYTCESMEVKNITAKNIINKYNNMQFFSEGDDESVIFMNIFSAS
jgi:hypothetical protein